MVTTTKAIGREGKKMNLDKTLENADWPKRTDDVLEEPKEEKKEDSKKQA